MFMASPTVFANEEEFIIDVNDTNSVVVSEETVIQDFMSIEGVDRETALKELGITSSGTVLKQQDLYNTTATCTYQWRYVSGPKKLIHSGSKTYLTLHVHAQIRSCPSGRAFTNVGAVSHSVSSFFSNNVVFNGTASAGRNGTSSISLAAMGYIKNPLGINVGNWVYTGTAYPGRTYSGGGSTF